MGFLDLSTIERFTLASKAADEAEAFFESKAKERKEGALLVGGQATAPREFLLDLVFVPEQEATAMDVVLHPDSLKAISARLPELGRMFAVQIHTHPTYAFHSSVDNADTTLTQHGCLSIVVPFFGVMGLRDQRGWALFRRSRSAWCGPLPVDEVERLFIVEEAGS